MGLVGSGSLFPDFLLAWYRTVRYEPRMNERVNIDPANDAIESSPTKREQEVLSVVLDLMVEEGDGFSMASVARRASCSKETLYRWYGDRDGLLTATVQWQAAKVIMPKLEEGEVTLSAFRQTLEDFAISWLAVLTSDVSIALNRLAVSHAGNGKTNLGQIVLENGPLAMRRRLLPIFSIGEANGFIKRSGDAAFRLFFGLVIAEAQIRALLGDKQKPNKKEIKEFARDATEKFLILCGKD